jgi:HEAT repeat protein
MRSTVLAVMVATGLALGAPSALRADDAPPAAPKAGTARTAEQMATLRASIPAGFADAKSPANRAAAAQLVVAAWPDSAAVLDEALASNDADVRLEAVRVLERAELGDVKPRLLKRFDDAAESVRRQAIRVARKLVWPEAEPRYVDAVATDAAWSVRQEALRALEDRGTVKCLRVVLDGFAGEKNVDRRRSYRRVLLALLAADHGDDVEAWRAAVDEAELRARKVK